MARPRASRSLETADYLSEYYSGTELNHESTKVRKHERRKTRMNRMACFSMIPFFVFSYFRAFVIQFFVRN